MKVIDIIKVYIKVLFKILIFKQKSEYNRWFEIAISVSVWFNLIVVLYSILKSINYV
jgi:hypothetical protein